VSDAANATFFLGRESVVACRARGGAGASGCTRSCTTTPPGGEFFGIPPNQVLEVGSQVEI
jgi:K+ transporter